MQNPFLIHTAQKIIEEEEKASRRINMFQEQDNFLTFKDEESGKSLDDQISSLKETMSKLDQKINEMKEMNARLRGKMEAYRELIQSLLKSEFGGEQ